MSITPQFFPVVSENSLYFSELTHKYTSKNESEEITQELSTLKKGN